MKYLVNLLIVMIISNINKNGKCSYINKSLSHPQIGDVLQTGNIQIVIGERGWIIEAIGKQWYEFFLDSLCNSKIEINYGEPRIGADVYFHFIYLNAKPVIGARNIVYVTHVDYFAKGLVLLKLAMQGVEFVTMSVQTKDLVERFVPGVVVYCVTPSSLHFIETNKTQNKRLIFGLFFRIYPDKRKNNEQLASLIRLVEDNPNNSSLIIYGSGFEKYINKMNGDNISYDNSHFSVDAYRAYLTRCDYVVYLGTDEGAISVLDAATLGIPVLATKQGYHKDITLPKGSMLFKDGKDVIVAIKNMLNSYAQKSVMINPAKIIHQSPRPFTRRYLWLFYASAIPFRRNPFRAKNDVIYSLKFMFNSVLRRLSTML